MISFIKHKIKNKKWLNSCLLTGVVLLSAFLCIYPMFREGSLNKLLQTLFIEHIEEYEEYPAVISRSDTVSTEDYPSVDEIIAGMDEYEKSWTSYLTLPVVEKQQIVHFMGGNSETTFGEKSRLITIGYMPDLYEHAEVVHGINAEDARSSDHNLIKEAIAQGAVPCTISESLMDRYGLVIGEVLTLKFKTYSDEKPISFVVAGIIEEKSDTDTFWHNRLDSYSYMVYVTKEDFDAVINQYQIQSIDYDEIVMLDYTKININNAKLFSSYLTEFRELDSELSENFGNLLSTYTEKEKTVNVILFTFELPIISLLLLFLYMISGQILEMETTEISMLKSRGVSRRKVILLYVLQSAIISVIGAVLGLPLGYLFCKCGAGTNGFLSFTLKDVSIYHATWEMLLFAMIAFVLAVLFMTIPVIKLSTLTITERKSRKLGSKEKAGWEKYYIDIALLVVSGYLLYNYYKQSSAISIQIINGGSVDPIIFLNSSLFILSCGLLFLRLIHYLVRLIYHIGRKKWKPASYISFLQITRSTKKQGFISVFLVMTIAIGIFNANLARTINENMEQRVRYNIGTDLKIEEKWKLRTELVGEETKWAYTEPDYGRYDELDTLGVQEKTKVITDKHVDFSFNSKIENDCMLMGIHTKEFGETARLKDGLNDRHWFYYLNELAKQPNGVLISSNLAQKYKLKDGDTIYYSRYSPINAKKVELKTAARICGIIDSFPGYESTVYTTTDEGKIEDRENYLIVAHYSTVVSNFTITPYHVWVRLSEDADPDQIIERAKELGINVISSQSSQQLIQAEKDSAMLQITNGMFSVGFMISLLICAVGFLIYWVLTIRERELLYGIYRAMGMSMKEIVRMLIIEQVFSSLLAASAGFLVGMITTFLFTKLISIVYLPQMHNIAISIFIEAQDSIKMLCIIAAVFIACFIVIRRIVKNMNITKGLKLGAD